MQYECKYCHHTFNTFHLSCPDCGRWNSFISHSQRLTAADARPVSLRHARASSVKRLKTKISKVDKVLGGGFVPGSSVLLFGPPGIGKSTFVMQLLSSLNVTSLYVTGEESVDQVKLRANRLQVHSESIFLLFETNVNKVIIHADSLDARILIIDSIQTVYTDLSDTLPGSITQIRKCSYILRRSAQKKGYVLVVIGHVTKNKTAAGPKLLEHAVDVVLHLEEQDAKSANRVLFTTKNRYGSTVPQCILSMSNQGLEFKKQK